MRAAQKPGRFTDPYELDNLLDSVNHQETAATLRQQLISKIETIEGVRVTIEPAPTTTRQARFPNTTIQQSGLKGRMLE
jgi:hypothetical protein